MTDLKRLIKLIPVVYNTRLLIGTAPGALLIPVFFAIIGAEPGAFYMGVLLSVLCRISLMNTMQQTEFSDMFRSSPYRRSLMIQAFPRLLLFMELCVFAVFFTAVLFASRKYPDMANRALFAVISYNLAVSLFVCTALSVQYKATGKGMVVYFVFYALGMGLFVLYPFTCGVLTNDSYILSFPDISPFLTFVAGVFGCFLTAFVFECAQRLVYPYSINRKYLDQLK
ncbi:MAG: hypothetical protein IJQ21_11510 [Lachnospiraceae bacterium]|nr:hypothetical protein [Lachnospiraceae bacterium]